MSTRTWPQRALARFPAASNGEFGIPPELVPVLERGRGSHVWDTSGREWLDMTMAWGSALVGHAHPRILEAATRAAADGFNFAAVNRRSVELAERLAAQCPCAERVRFVASGTEATMMCLRVARTATGRPKVLKFEGAYHGQHPVGITSMIAGRASNLPHSDPSGAGAPWVERDVLVAPFNDLEATVRILEAHATDLAAVIVEPFHRCIPPRPGFLEGLRAATRRLGIVLAFDEVVTGFRFAPGGAQEYYGVVPDLAAYGKALAGGFPLGAYAGRADLMEVVNEHRLPGPAYAWSASTTGGNPVSCAAALAALEVFAEPGIYPGLHTAGRNLRTRIAEVLTQAGEPGQALGDGPIAQVAFSATPVVDQTTWLASNRARGRALMLELLRRGVFLNPMGTKLYLSLAHTPADLDTFAEHLAAAVAATRS
jgi:glutamate-1-semialdehyde 2,1-aminomutase